jgi:chitosanase
MLLSDKQQRICEQVVNAFESGLTGVEYGAVSTNEVGPRHEHQISYGRTRTMEYGNLEELLTMYINSNGLYSLLIKPYLPKIGITPLADDEKFIRILKLAGIYDPAMQQIQDQFFNWLYFPPAMKWMDEKGFVLPLSAMVIYDSFIQSGGIHKFLRKRFPENVPCKGGHEKVWIRQYVDVRHDWLINHNNEILRNSAYRTSCFKNEIARCNWNLNLLPVVANEVDVFG